MNDTFQWTDELVKEFAGIYEYGANDTDLKAFKQSKMPKKEYEVIQIVNSKGGTIYKDRDDISWEQYADLHSFEGFTIKKVKRLSDGEMFSVGGINEYPTGLQQPIIEFKVSEETPTMMLFRTCNEIWQNISIAKKAQPKKERIEVTLYNYSTGYCLISFKQKMSDKQQRLLAAAVENILNND